MRKFSYKNFLIFLAYVLCLGVIIWLGASYFNVIANNEKTNGAISDWNAFKIFADVAERGVNK